MSKTGTHEAFVKAVELNIVEYLREYADAAEASGSGHWAVAMREAAKQLQAHVQSNLSAMSDISGLK